MRISKIMKNIKCDTVLCNKSASYEIESKSYKGSIFLCEDCFIAMQKLFKKVAEKWIKNNSFMKEEIMNFHGN